jgi:uncharacterized protein (UPF0332 family)
MKETTGRLLKKAHRAIQAAETLVENRLAEFAVGRAYYAMFYTAEVLLNEKGKRFRKHQGVHIAFAEHFVKTSALDSKYHRWLVAAFNKRITGDYGVAVRIGVKEVEDLIVQAQEFLEAARQHLGLAP